MAFDEAEKESISGWSDVISREVPELKDIADIDMHHLFLEDSSNINHTHWSELATLIKSYYDSYDGFIILHGTDTMAYTASALSFCLQNIQKPVILTGSQVPMAQLRSDARRNLVNAVELATLDIGEVAICFNDHLFRGNRSTKTSIGDFDAFTSPNYPPLAEVGITIERKTNEEYKNGEPVWYNKFSDEIALITVHPNLHHQFLDCMNLKTTRAVVLQAFGSGNFPIKGEYNLIPFLKKCRQNDVLVLICSQALYDSVDLNAYESGREALKLDALGAKNMTLEACLTKLMFLFGNYNTTEKIRRLVQQPIAGEIG